MSKISYSVLKKLKLERLMKRQSNFDNVIVFDEEFELKYNHCGNKHYWLAFVDFCTTYKYDPNTSCLKTASYKDIVDKANEWIRRLPQYQRNERLIPGQPIWMVFNCETLYAKISINFNENGEIVRKRVMQFSKWPLNDELFMNIYCETNTMIQNFEQVFNGRYIVVLLRVWLKKHPYFPLMLIDPPDTICFKDYWPKRISFKENDCGNEQKQKTLKKSQDLKRKLKKTLSIDGGCGHHPTPPPSSSSSSSAAASSSANVSNVHHHGDSKEYLEKIQEILKRINDDIINDHIDGDILNVVTFPCYNNKENIQSEIKIDLGKISGGHIVNLVRVFYLLNQPIYPYDGPESEHTNRRKIHLIGIMDFVPRCISSGGFIKYPRFETQTDILDKATMWMTKHRQFKFLNFSSVDIRLKSMTSIDSGEMTFARNTGDFVRILRLVYLKPIINDKEVDHTDVGPVNNGDDENDPLTLSMAEVVNWTPPVAPIYLRRKHIVSINNSLKELQQQMNDYLVKVRKNEFNNNYNGERWKFLCADSAAIFISNLSSSGNSYNDVKNRKNNLQSDCDKSFHVISISSTNMNRNMLNCINIFYDIGMFGQTPRLLMMDSDQHSYQSLMAPRSADCVIHEYNHHHGEPSHSSNGKKEKNNRPNSSTTLTMPDQNSCHIS